MSVGGYASRVEFTPAAMMMRDQPGDGWDTFSNNFNVQNPQFIRNNSDSDGHDTEIKR